MSVSLGRLAIVAPSPDDISIPFVSVPACIMNPLFDSGRSIHCWIAAIPLLLMFTVYVPVVDGVKLASTLSSMSPAPPAPPGQALMPS